MGKQARQFHESFLGSHIIGRFFFLILALSACWLWAGQTKAQKKPPLLVPIRFTLPTDSRVTLVIEDDQGLRVRNLISDMPFKAGENTVWWDGLIAKPVNIERKTRHASHDVKYELAPPGNYSIRGLYHEKIDLLYQLTPYHPGSPPWYTDLRREPDAPWSWTSRGGWLSDMVPPSDVLFLPHGSPFSPKRQMMLSATHADRGDALAWVDIDGHKLAGRNRIRPPDVGALRLALDAGQSPERIYAVYVVQSDQKHHLGICEIQKNGQKEIFEKTFINTKTLDIGGSAAKNGVLVVSLPSDDKLLLIDAAAGKLMGHYPLKEARGVCYDSRGRLLAISAKSVVRFKGGVGWAEGTCFVPDTETFISDSLVRPFDLAIGPNKRIYVTDGGTHQVKVFSPDGNKVRSIGKPGGPQLGRYDPERMHNPRGIAITRGGALWVAEYSTSPRRISVWRTDGRYEKAFYGGPQWDSQGSVDLVDRSIFHYAEGDLGMQFRLDLADGTVDLETIYRRSGFLGRAPHVPIYVQGRKYMANRYDVHESGVGEPLGIWLWRDDRVIPVAAVGHTSQSKDFEPFSQVLGKNPKSLFIWSDLNGNGNAESEEFSFKKLEPCRLYVGSDLTIYTSHSYRLHPRQYTAGGVPVYDADEAQRVTSACDGFAGFGQGVTFPGADGSVIVTGAPIRGYKSGKQLWWYPNQWVGANLAKKVPHTSRRGQLNAAVRLLGQPFYPHSVKKMGVWGIASYNGPCYLFTTDGLFIGELLGDGREEDITSPKCRQGDSIKNMSMGVDTPAISLTHTADDQTYLVAGKSHHSIARITNLASIRRIKPFAIELVPSDLAKVLEYFKNTGAEQAEPYLMSGFKVTEKVREKLAQYRIRYESERIKREGRLSLQVSALNRAPILDGRFDGWRKADWVHIDKHTRAAVGFLKPRLYVAFQTKHDKLLMNNAEDPKQIFARGGALELFVGSNPDADPARQKPVAGDKRLVVTRIDGKVCAVLYQPVSPDEKKPHTFKSKDSKIHFDLVKECTADITIGQRPRHYEMSVPLKLLGIKPKNGLVLRGDLGIIKGREGSCVWRKCWNNQATSCGAGLKYEVKMYPQFWGEWHFPKGD